MFLASVRNIRRAFHGQSLPTGSLSQTSSVLAKVVKTRVRCGRIQYLCSSKDPNSDKKDGVPSDGVLGNGGVAGNSGPQTAPSGPSGATNKSDPQNMTSSKVDHGPQPTTSGANDTKQQSNQQKPTSSTDGKPHPTAKGHTDPHHPDHHKARDIAANLGSNIANTMHFTQQKYEELEKNIMESIHFKNQQRFRAILVGTLLVISWVTIVFGSRLRKYFTEQTAGFAKETLENKELKIQTQELATAVVQTILENKEIASHAAAFLKEASNVPETQQAMLNLALHILQHPDTQVEIAKVSQKLIKDLANNKDTVAELSTLFQKVLEDPDLKAALVILVGQLCQDAEVLSAVTDLVVKLGADQRVTEATSKLLSGSVNDVMQDEEVSQQSRLFIAEVVGDDLLQKEGGHALWQSIKYALSPGIIRVTGVTLVVVSAAFAKLMLSPY